MPPALALHGHVEPGFEAVRQTFEENFTKRAEIGAGLCVTHKGRVVVDLWGGVSDRATGREWTGDTLNIVFSTTKGLAATGLLMLADRGQLDYDRPVADYWPEFAAHGKAEITVRTLMNHRAGLLTVDEPLTLEDFEQRPEKIGQAVANQAPSWAPGTDQGYHGVSYGFFVAELFKRIAGESLGHFIRREIAHPLGADVHLGLAEEHEPRVATLYPVSRKEALTQVIPKMLASRSVEGRVYRQIVFKGDAARAFSNPAELGAKGMVTFGTRRVRALELPWSSAVASARGLARMYAALANGGSVDGVQLVRPETIAPVMPRQSWSDRDRVLRKPIGWSQGYVKEAGVFSPNPESFGHPGAGGSLGWCDPVANVSIGYVMNRMDHRIRSPRAIAICDAVYRSLAG
jgi:CubicO group peptidase (beta-lactamase class C family)